MQRDICVTERGGESERPGLDFSTMEQSTEAEAEFYVSDSFPGVEKTLAFEISTNKGDSDLQGR